jgi:CHAD domain-containing protein
MPFQFKQTESVADGVRRIAMDQLDRAIASVAQPVGDADAVVHDVRRRCKRVRAVVRLVRTSLVGFNEHDDWLRDTASLLSGARDAAVLPATHAVVVAAADLVGVAEAMHVFESLRQPCETTELTLDLQGAALETVKLRLLKLCKAVECWRLEISGFDAMGKGLRTTYARARNAMRKAQRSSSTADCHQWRKRVKYHAFHIRLLRDVWPRAMHARVAAADELGDLLGQVHDFAVYRAAIDAAPTNPSTEHAAEALREAAALLGEDLLAQCWPLGQRLFALAPTTFVDELETYWDAWRAARHPAQLADPASRSARRKGA